MKKVFQLEDLDCANCAAKMQDAILKIDGVTDAEVNFLLQKMTITADDASFNKIMKQVAKTCHKIEPDCEIIM